MGDVGHSIQEGHAARCHLRGILEGKKFADELRNVLVCGYVDLALEHQQALLVLTEAQLYGSAFALVRPLYEVALRGLWVKACATDGQVQCVERGQRDAFLSGSKMAQAVDKNCFLVRPGQTRGFFGEIWENSSGSMHDYVHGSVRAVSRRFDASVVKPKYADGEIIEVIRFSTTTIFILMRCFFAVMNCKNEAAEVESLMGSYFNFDIPKGQG